MEAEAQAFTSLECVSSHVELCFSKATQTRADELPHFDDVGEDADDRSSMTMAERSMDETLLT